MEYLEIRVADEYLKRSRTIQTTLVTVDQTATTGVHTLISTVKCSSDQHHNSSSESPDMTHTWALVLAAVVLYSVPSGVFLQQEACEDIKIFVFSFYNCFNKSLTSVPEGIIANVTHLLLASNKLTALRDNEFLQKGGANIEGLSLYSNSIAELEHDAFSGLKNLSLVVLSTNNITFFNKDIFSGNLKLEQLHLRDNPLKEINFTTVPLLTSDSLTLLDLSSCGMTRISEVLFSELPNLKWLYLRDNKLTAVVWSSLSHLRKLEIVDLSGNVIRHFACEPEMVRRLEESHGPPHNLSVLSAPLWTIDTWDGEAAKGIVLEGNPLECDCCLSLMTYALSKTSWYLPSTGDSTCPGIPVFGYYMPTVEDLQRCYTTFLEPYNRTDAGIVNQF